MITIKFVDSQFGGKRIEVTNNEGHMSLLTAGSMVHDHETAVLTLCDLGVYEGDALDALAHARILGVATIPPQPAVSLPSKVWVAVANHVDVNDGIDPLVCVGTTKEAADSALQDAIHDSVDPEDDNADTQIAMWIEEHAVELPVHGPRPAPLDNAPVPFEVTEENVESVHTHLEGCMEVFVDDNDTTSERYTAMERALLDSVGHSDPGKLFTLPVMITVPRWLAVELQDAIDDDQFE